LTIPFSISYRDPGKPGGYLAVGANSGFPVILQKYTMSDRLPFAFCDCRRNRGIVLAATARD
jgi:hypothetical protein